MLKSLFSETRDEAKFQEYKIQHNKAKKLLRNAWKEKERGIALDSKKNSKNFWKFDKSQLKCKPALSPLIGKDKKERKNEQEQAEVLSKFF